jgi:MinD-like ATPase involved in chromosome partitioning or flagellar assembly
MNYLPIISKYQLIYSHRQRHHLISIIEQACEKGIPYITQAPNTPTSKALLAISHKVESKLLVEKIEVEE